MKNIRFMICAAMVAAFVDLTERAGPEHLARLEAMVAERLSSSKGRRR